MLHVPSTVQEKYHYSGDYVAYDNHDDDYTVPAASAASAPSRHNPRAQPEAAAAFRAGPICGGAAQLLPVVIVSISRNMV